MNNIEITFVIPAKNEAGMIEKCLKSLLPVANICPNEVIVVDNGSTDSTASIAKALGARVLFKADGTIGALRNYGASESQGNILIFIDADVVLTSEWLSNLPLLTINIRKNYKLISGSQCAAPVSDPKYLRNWFNSIANEKYSRHIGTGHLIVTKPFFDEIGGFDESLSSGEDYSFCRAATKLGALIENRPDLKVLHLDFPKDIRSFIEREAWHGKSDASNIHTILKSKVSIAAFFFLGLHVALLASVLNGYLLGIAVSILMIIIFPAIIVLYKFHERDIELFLSNTFICYFYLMGRAISLKNIWQR